MSWPFQRVDGKIDYPKFDAAQPGSSSLREKFGVTRKRLMWGPKDIEEFRARLSLNVVLQNAFYTQLNL